MIPRSIKLIWLKPKRWNDLTKWGIDEEVAINGYVVRRGFITDGGSIPFLFRRSFNPVGKGFPAFVAHDLKCKSLDYSRKLADIDLYQDLQDCGVNRFRAKAMYFAVRSYAIATRKK